MGTGRDGDGPRYAPITHSLAHAHALPVVVARKSVIINNPSSLSYHCFTLLIVVIDQVSCFFLIPFLTSLLSFKSRSGYRLFHSLLSPSLIYHNHCKQSPVPTANMRFSYAVVALIGAANAMVRAHTPLPYPLTCPPIRLDIIMLTHLLAQSRKPRDRAQRLQRR